MILSTIEEVGSCTASRVNAETLVKGMMTTEVIFGVGRTSRSKSKMRRGWRYQNSAGPSATLCENQLVSL